MLVVTILIEQIGSFFYFAIFNVVNTTLIMENAKDYLILKIKEQWDDKSIVL